MTVSLAANQALIVDMDGVLWRGAYVLPGVADFFSFLTQHSIRVLLATNNATLRAEDYVARLEGMGVHIAREQVLTSADATARWMTREFPAGARVYVIGENGLLDALVQNGFQIAEKDVAAVVVGLDRMLTYEKLRRATLELRAGARFIATNGDKTLPTEQGLVPGAGSIVAALVAASAVTPTVIGKPHRPMFDLALEILRSDRAHTAMLGDRLDTDIAGAHAAGLRTIMVLTGVSTRDEAYASAIKPDFIFENLPDLIQVWKASLQKRTS